MAKRKVKIPLDKLIQKSFDYIFRVINYSLSNHTTINEELTYSTICKYYEKCSDELTIHIDYKDGKKYEFVGNHIVVLWMWYVRKEVMFTAKVKQGDDTFRSTQRSESFNYTQLDLYTYFAKIVAKYGIELNSSINVTAFNVDKTEIDLMNMKYGERYK